MKTDLIIIGIMTFLNVFYATLTFLAKRDDREQMNKLVKAVIAKDAREYALTESSPKEDIEKMRVENALAINAAKIAPNDEYEHAIPIT